MIPFPLITEFLIASSATLAVCLTLLLTYKLKKTNPNLFHSNRIYKDKTQKILNFNLLYTLVGWAFAFGATSFAIGILSIFVLYSEWLLGENYGKFFILMAIAAGILFYFQKSYFFIKDNV